MHHSYTIQCVITWVEANERYNYAPSAMFRGSADNIGSCAAAQYNSLGFANVGSTVVCAPSMAIVATPTFLDF